MRGFSQRGSLAPLLSWPAPGWPLRLEGAAANPGKRRPEPRRAPPGDTHGCRLTRHHPKACRRAVTVADQAKVVNINAGASYDVYIGRQRGPKMWAGVTIFLAARGPTRSRRARTARSKRSSTSTSATSLARGRIL